ncbi:MAG: LOG family protein [Phycisphaerales bacterium]|nr:LOG family protein [Phycisphaerales bacterium]
MIERDEKAASQNRPNVINPLTEAGRMERDRDITAFAAKHLAGPNQDLFEDLLTTMARLARDQTGRGDMKLLHKAIAELRYGFKVFRPYQHVRKISIFGSSRTPEADPDYEAAVDFGRAMSEAGWMVITGAGDGIMKAGHGGAGREASFGVAIRLPFEQKTNTIIAEDAKLVNFRYFFTRKLMFMKEASAVALFPGGFGTQDEGFEALTLVQTGKAPIVPIVMIEHRGGTYWPHWRTYVERELLNKGMISPADMSLFRIADSYQAAVDEVIRFYRVYHSMRWVNDDLLLRLEQPISARLLDRLNLEFRGIITDGKIELSKALPEEAAEFPEKPRLRMRFDKRSIGLLRQLIDQVNADE